MATITGYGSKHSHEFKLTVNETSISTVNNTSEVSFSFTIYKASYSWNNWNSITYSIIINGTSYSGTIPSYSAGSTLTIRSGSQTIPHNSDGTKTINYSFSVNDGSGQSYTCGNASASGNFTLTAIPRASSISCTTANIGETAIVIINSAVSSFRHTVKVTFGDLNLTIAENQAGGSFAWTIPEDFYAKIPIWKYGVGTITCDTYNNGSLIGSKSSQFTATTNEEKCKPSISATVIDTNSKTIALTGSNEKLIKHKSTAKITITASAKNSSSISTKKINNIDVSEDSISITEIETDTFVITVTDSRGYSNSVTLKPNVVDYIPLTINSEIKRVQPTTGEVGIVFSGNYFNESFGDINNTLTLNWYYREKGENDWIAGGNLNTVISNNTYNNGTSTISLGKIFDYQKSYEFYLEVFDKLTTLNPLYTVTQGIPIFNWGKDFFNINGNFLINEKNINDKLNGITLYENENGTQDTITLSESISEFSFIAIVDNFKKVHFYDAVNGRVDIETFYMANSVTFRHFCAYLDISDNTITLREQHFYDQNGYQEEYEGLSIIKVIGY